MEKIEVIEEFDFLPEEVWNYITDHERYTDYADLSESVLLKYGHSEKNGLGAVRKIHTGKTEFIEEITAFEKPVKFSYLITACSIPIKHNGGTISLEPTIGKTRVTWVSEFEMPEGTSAALIRGAKASSAKMFKEILTGIKGLLEGSGESII